MAPQPQSRSDRRLLRAMTKYHEIEDPAWVARMRGPVRQVPRPSRTPRIVALGLAGFAAIIAGATTNTFPMIFLGVVALMVALCLRLTATPSRKS
jgi:DUF3040 family protein